MAGSGCAKYIGRVGALAVALGVTGAVGTAPGIAWADETSSPSATADSSPSPGSATDTSAPTSDTDPGPEADDTTAAGSLPVSGATSEPQPELSEAATEVTTADGDVVIRASGGAQVSGTDDSQAEDGADTAGDDEEDAVDVAEEDAADLGEENEEVQDGPRDDTTVRQDDDALTDAAQSVTPSGDTATAPADDTATAPTDELGASEPHLESQVAQASVARVALAPPRLPAPTEVVQQVKKAVTTCVCGLIDGTVKLINAAMAVFSGGVTTGPAAPASPTENPLLMGVLAWARRETTRVVEALSRTPVAQFLHGVTMRVTQAITDFGNSPLGRQISAEIGQFLQQCQESASLPDDLERVALVTGLTEPTDFAFLRDETDTDALHRIFITEKSGAIKVYNPHDGSVTTLTSLPTVTADGERGLVGVEVDPDFWAAGAEGYHTVYVAYTAADNYDQLSKLKLDPTTFAVTDETVLLKSTELGNNFHHGGELQFDPAGEYLYWAVGDNTESTNAQDLTNIHGKILRLDRNGDAPQDNPFYSTPGAVKQIYAIGLRNPFRFTFAPTGALLVGDVGEADWEELNVVTAGANYGWPEVEGECTGCEYVNPIYAYRHSAPPANAGSITSVLVYTGTTLPEHYRNKVFIADYSVGWIKELTFDDEFSSLISERTLDNRAGTTVKLDQGPDGNIYQLNIYPGQLSVIRPSGGNRAPTAVITASSTSGAGDSLEVQFSAADSSDPENDRLQYQWNFGNGRTSTDANPSMVFTNTGDDFTAYTVTLRVSDGDKTSTATQRIVVGSTPPTASIRDTLPLKYNAGDTITFEADGSDVDETLPSSAYKWTVVFHHADHVHPFRDNIIGTTGSVTIPRTRDQLGNTFYRVTLTVTDSSGLSTTTYRDVHPNTIRLAVTASDPDATFTIDGVPYRGSYVEEEAVVGVERVVNAPSPQPDSDGQLVFRSWSDGGAQSHTITTPEADTVYTVTYDLIPSESGIVV